MIEILSNKYLLAGSWILAILWGIRLLWLHKCKLEFWYWDCGFALLLTLAFSTALARLLQTFSIDNKWLFIVPILFLIFDFAENALYIAKLKGNSTEIAKFPDTSPIFIFFTVGKWVFVALWLVILIGLPLYYWLLKPK